MRVLLQGLIVVWLLGGCSSERPTKTGFPVEAEGHCHTLLQLQCQCCEAGEMNCRAHVDALVASGTANINMEEAACKTDAKSAAADIDSYCGRFKTAEDLQFVCQQYYVKHPDEDVSEP